MKSREIFLSDFFPEVQRELLKRGFADENNEIFPLFILEVEDEEQTDGEDE